jgi:hypothetical protein
MKHRAMIPIESCLEGGGGEEAESKNYKLKHTLKDIQTQNGSIC